MSENRPLVSSEEQSPIFNEDRPYESFKMSPRIIDHDEDDEQDLYR